MILLIFTLKAIIFNGAKRLFVVGLLYADKKWPDGQETSGREKNAQTIKQRPGGQKTTGHNYDLKHS